MTERRAPPASEPASAASPHSRGDTDFGREESWFAALGLAARDTRPGRFPSGAEAGPRSTAPDAARAHSDAHAPAPAEGPADAFGTATRPPSDPLSRASRPGAAQAPAPQASATRPGVAGAAASPTDAGEISEPAARRAAVATGTAPRLYGAFATSRLLLAALMLALPYVPVLLPLPTVQPWLSVLAVFYLLLTGATWRAAPQTSGVLNGEGQLKRRWMLATVGVDLGVFSALLLLLNGSLNVTALFALPVLMAGALCGRLIALAAAAASTFVLLIHGVVQSTVADNSVLLTQTGLGCAGLFAIAWLTTELASRLAREERSARSSLALARQQALLNRLVIEEMEDGILVVDRAGKVRVANPSALSLIGASSDLRLQVFSLAGRVGWQPLLDAVREAFRQGGWPPGGRDIVVSAAGHGGRNQAAPTADRERPLERPLRVRMRFTRRQEQELGESLCVVFLEDVRALRLRARQDKLAAMGRVSAGIAHEIRNPLAAIAQANALLAEELQDAGQQRLSRMVADNVERLRRIVEDVMAAAPGGNDREAPLIDLCVHVRQIVSDWAHTNQQALEPGSRVVLDLPAAPAPAWPVRMEPDHLARVLVNLLDNALDHSHPRPGAIQVSLGLQARARASDPPNLGATLSQRRMGPRSAALLVSSDGAAISAEVEASLFEPFFSTRSRGTGLGLYICRELCMRHGVSIEYRRGAPGDRHNNVFALQLQVEQVAALADNA